MRTNDRNMPSWLQQPRVAVVAVALLLCGLAQANEPQLAGTQAWVQKSQGIDAVRLTAIGIDPLTPTTLYTGTWGAGLYKSIDSGASWQPINDGLADLYSGDLAVDPVQEGTIYAYLYYGGLYKSTDGGRSWRNMYVFPLGCAVVGARIIIAPSDPNVLYMAGRSLCRSPDGGNTWIDRDVTTGAFDVASDDADKLYMYDGRLVKKTTDGGASFIDITRDLPPSLGYGDSAITVDPTNSDVIYVGISGQGLFRSTDGGDSWSMLGDIGHGPNYGPVTVDPLNPRVLYMGAAAYPRQGFLFKSEDRGDSWTDTGFPYGVGRVVLDPTDDRVMYLASWSFFYSRDALDTYTESIDGFHNLPILRIALDPNLPGLVYAASRFGLYVTPDNGDHWQRSTDFPADYVLGLVVDPNQSGVAYASAGFSPSRLMRTEDGGATWNALNSLSSYDRAVTLAVAPGHSEVIYVQANGAGFNGILRTNDRGETWSQLSLPVSCSFDCSSMVAFSDVVAVVNTGPVNGLWKTNDGGASWSVFGPTDLDGFRSLAADAGNPDVIFVGSSGIGPGARHPGLRKSVNGGASWFSPNAQFDHAVVYQLASSAADGRLYLVSSGDGLHTRIFVSNDGGTTFVLANDGLSNNQVTALAPDPSLACHAFAGTAYSAVFETMNAGGDCT